MNRKDLIDYKYLKIRINTYRERYEEKFNNITSTVTHLDGMPKGHNKPNYALEEFIDNSNELIKLYNEETQKERDILDQLRMIENEKYRTVLYLRYIVYPLEKNPLEMTASDMNYSYNEVCKFNGEALNEFDKLGEKLQDCIENHKTS